MERTESDIIIQEFHQFINDVEYPCVAAKAAMARNNVPCVVAGHMGCPRDDGRIVEFLYDFIDSFRKAGSGFRSAAVIFESPQETPVQAFDHLLWQRLQSLSDLDAKRFAYDKRVSADPDDANFSFSIGEEAFFVIGLHPGSPRPARRFSRPAMVFNPHEQFEELRTLNRYEKLKKIVRHRDVAYSGSINPMLNDFGKTSEVWQYSGRQYDERPTCPLKIKHGESNDYTPEK